MDHPKVSDTPASAHLKDAWQLVGRIGEAVRRSRNRLHLSGWGLAAVSVALSAFLAAAMVLSAVSEDVMSSDGLEVRDPANLQLFTDHRSGWLVSLARALSQVGSVGVLVLVAVAAGVVLWFRGARIVAAAAPMTALLAGGACAAAGKVLVARQRPPVPLRLVSESDASFPSGHSTDSTALFLTLGLVVAVVLLRRPLARVATVAGAALLAGLVGLSRLVLGVHWPTDVLAGWSLGSAVAVAVATVALLLDHLDSARPAPARADRSRVVAKVRRVLTADRASLRAATT